MKIVKTKLKRKNLMLWQDIPIGTIYRGLDEGGTDYGQICLKVSHEKVFNLTTNHIMNKISDLHYREILPNVELNLNEYI